jgi:acyl-coenzyme A synthetase/AMP-(fatty) acid ligase
VVVGRELPDGNEDVVAYVELAANKSTSADELADYAAGQLAPYKRPAKIVVMRALPASATGKVLRGQLKALASRERNDSDDAR